MRTVCALLASVTIGGLAVLAGSASAAPTTTLLPFPDDRLTVADASTETGRRLALPRAAMPASRLGSRIDPTDMNRADGFSPGSAILVQVPGLNNADALRRTRAPTIDDPARSLRASSPIRVVNVRTGRPHLVWAEMDLNTGSDANRALIIRPAVNFAEGERYRVVLRRLRDRDGHRVRAPKPWTFTVASARSTTGRLLAMRDAMFAGWGDTNLADRVVAGRAPTFTVNPDLPDALPDLPIDLPLVGAPGPSRVDGVREGEPGGKVERVVRGTLRVPCFLASPGCAGGAPFALGADGLPRQLPGNTQTVEFTCFVPRTADPTAKLRPLLYGHGLFGSRDELLSGQLQDLASEHGFLPCAVDWSGMATADVPNALVTLQDLSRFNAFVDPIQQGMLGFLALGRLMIHPDGFAREPAFGGRIDTSELYYDGNSQGGIYGGTLTAVAPDVRRAVLGVPGMNYALLLQRSVDFDMYAHGSLEGVDTPLGLYDAYPDPLDQLVALHVIQLLWDRADPNGYAHHMTSRPLPNTPPHEVLLHVAHGDHQVADVAAEVEARTIGARVHRPALVMDRYRNLQDAGVAADDDPRPRPEPFFGIPTLPDGWRGSALVVWDSGRTPPPPAGNVPPRDGTDPHSAPRKDAAARRQKSEFLRPDGRVVDVCAGQPCRATGG